MRAVSPFDVPSSGFRFKIQTYHICKDDGGDNKSDGI